MTDLETLQHIKILLLVINPTPTVLCFNLKKIDFVGINITGLFFKLKNILKNAQQKELDGKQNKKLKKQLQKDMMI